MCIGLWERCLEQLEENSHQQMGLCHHAGGRTGQKQTKQQTNKQGTQESPQKVKFKAVSMCGSFANIVQSHICNTEICC